MACALLCVVTVDARPLRVARALKPTLSQADETSLQKGVDAARAGRLREAAEILVGVAASASSARADCHAAAAFKVLDRISEALFWIERSRERGDEPPVWCAELRSGLLTEIETRGMARSEVVVKPADAVLEVFAEPTLIIASPVVLWEEPGRRLEVVARAPGYDEQHFVIARTGHRIELAPDRPVSARSVVPAIRPAVRRSAWPALTLASVGAVATALGVWQHLEANAARRAANEHVPTSREFGGALEQFRTHRLYAGIGYAVGGLALGTSALWWWRFGRDRQRASSLTVDARAGSVTLGVAGVFP